MRSTRSNFAADSVPAGRSAGAAFAAPTGGSANGGPAAVSVPAELVRHGIRIVEGNTGDHALLPNLLLAAGCGCSLAEFQSQLEEPGYEPNDRLIAWHGGAMVGHARLAVREMQYGPLRLPVVELVDLVILPEYANWGLADYLLQESDARMRACGAVAGLARAVEPAPFDAAGWSIRGRDCFSTAEPRKLLSRLRELEVRARPRLSLVFDDTPADSLRVQLFRQVEQNALMRLYDANAATAFGWYARSETYWNWLTSRRGYDRIYVATRGEPNASLVENASAIVAYAAMRDDQIVEVMNDDGEDAAVRALLSRAVADALERGLQEVRFDGPPNSPLHELLRESGGETRETTRHGGRSRRLKLFQPYALLRQFGPLLLERVRRAELAIPVQLGLLVDGDRNQLEIASDGVRLISDRLGRSYLELESDVFARMLWGATSVEKLLASGSAVASTQAAARMAEILFPRLPLWYPPWDNLPCR